jgi:hypothetical protein
MRRILPTLAVLLAISSMAHAQTPGGTPAMGATSSLGVPGTSVMPQTALMPGTAATPLAATELNSGGLSPMPPSCSTGANAMFDGEGLTGCPSSSASQPAPGGSSMPLSPASGMPPTLIGGAIPLGAIETNTGAGLSPTVIAPGLTTGLTPSSPTMADPSATPGLPAPSMPPALALPSTTPCTGAAGSIGGAIMIQESPAGC